MPTSATAIDNAMVVADIDDDGVVLNIRPDASANLLEVIAVTKDDDDELVIHAMALRRKYRPPPARVGGSR